MINVFEFFQFSFQLIQALLNQLYKYLLNFEGIFAKFDIIFDNFEIR